MQQILIQDISIQKMSYIYLMLFHIPGINHTDIRTQWQQLI